MSQVVVEIDGKSYRMACEEGQEAHLSDLASKFDHYVTHLRSQFGEIGDLRLTVMAGIMVMDELSELQGKLKDMEVELNITRSNRDEALKNADKIDADTALVLSEVAEKISDIAQKLEEN